jgi:hypothetical protein
MVTGNPRPRHHFNIRNAMVPCPPCFDVARLPNVLDLIAAVNRKVDSADRRQSAQIINWGARKPENVP